MSSTSTNSKAFDPSRQVSFHQLLLAARRRWLIDALSEALAEIDPNRLKQELMVYVPPDVQSIRASAGIRDEHVFPTPAILAAKPTLVGYYRLVLGIPQKSFYGSGTGMGRFKSMEARGTITERQKSALPTLCETLSEGLANLVRQLSPAPTPRDIRELPLLILGSQFQGGANNAIGRQAILQVFRAIGDLVANHLISHSGRELRITNAAGRLVVVALGPDPDIVIQEEFADALRNKVALEVKGGADVSNVHNRAGEAEKSHLKAQAADFRDFWTAIAMKGADASRLRTDSPTTTSWFDIAQLLAQEGSSWDDFRSRIAQEIGIPL